MKYIRTKDGIYEVERYYEPHDYWWAKQLSSPIATDEIIKQADAIEKLCDGFVLINKNSDLLPSFKKSYHDFSPYLDVDIRSHEKPSYIEIYGAIWTDKGLIYVAKMNGKGELELLWD